MNVSALQNSGPVLTCLVLVWVLLVVVKMENPIMLYPVLCMMQSVWMQYQEVDQAVQHTLLLVWVAALGLGHVWIMQCSACGPHVS
jgi:hypothetical protein